MIDPSEPLEVQVAKQAKIIDALIGRANKSHGVGGSAYSLFQSAVALQGEVWEKTRDLEEALDTLGRASNELETAHHARERLQKNLADALEAMEGGFALFSDGKLQICNDVFSNLLPDLGAKIVPGLDIADYFKAVRESGYVHTEHESDPEALLEAAVRPDDDSAPPLVLALKKDRWFQITHRRTSSDNIVVLQTEITDLVRQNRHEKDRLIDEHTRFLQAAFDHISIGICTFSAEGELLIHNGRFGELLGLPVALTKKGTSFVRIFESIKKNQMLREGEKSPEYKNWVENVRLGRAVMQRIRYNDGSSLDVRIQNLPDGGFIASILDATAETDAAESLQRINETLEKRVRERTTELTQANLLLRSQYEDQAKVEEDLRIAKEAAEAADTSKTRFLAAASHDLLQPINAAKLLISTLSEYSTGTNMADTVRRLDKSFRSIESLLQALLDISRLDSAGAEFNVAGFRIDRILQALKEDLAPLAAEKGIRLDIINSSLWVESDQRYLQRSIQNLVVNAIQYTDEGRVLVGCRRRGNKVLLDVWDTGIGIPKKDQTRIFKEFTRINGKNSASGMGLGLSIVERACRHLNHPIRVRSKPGIGSVFTIELPVAEPGINVSIERASRTHESIADMDLIVVIVENDPDVLFATTQKIEAWGASVLGAESTHDALELVRQIGVPPDIILADFQLNGDDNGIDAIMALRALTKTEIPAIMITADRSEALLKSGEDFGFTLLTKPVQLSRLRPLIDWKTRHRAA